VVDSTGKLLGVVSLSDIVKTRAYSGARKSPKRHEFYDGVWEDSLSPEDLEGLQLEEDNGLCAQDIMTPVIICVQENTSLAEMADIMVSGRIHRVIVTRHGKIAGIVTTMDILEEIRDCARQEKNARIPEVLS
jgi:CBS domain-containing protein